MTEQVQLGAEETSANDVDTQLATFEASYEQVRDGDERAKKLLAEAEPVLREIYEAARQRQDDRQMELVNQSYDRVQSLVNIIGQQGAALHGANTGISAIKGQLNQALDELNVLLNAMKTFEEEDHPELEKFAAQLRDWEGEYYAAQMEEIKEDAILEMQETRVRTILDCYLDFDNHVDLHQATKLFCKFLNDNLMPNAEQQELLQKLVDSFLHDERC